MGIGKKIFMVCTTPIVAVMALPLLIIGAVVLFAAIGCAAAGVLLDVCFGTTPVEVFPFEDE